jgi:hypothetical protein
MKPGNKPMRVRKFITIKQSDETGLQLVFASGRTLVAKTFSNSGEVLQDRQAEIIETENEGDRIKWSSAYVEHWYDDFFLANGSQKIKNAGDAGVDRKRKVIYISKVSMTADD